MSEKPGGVVALAILVMIFAIFQILGGIFVAFFLTETSIFFTPVYAYMIPGMILIFFGVFWLIIGIGLWMLWNWARILAIVFGILGIIGSIIIIITGLAAGVIVLLGIVELILSLVIVVYLFQEDVAAYFT